MQHVAAVACCLLYHAARRLLVAVECLPGRVGHPCRDAGGHLFGRSSVGSSDFEPAANRLKRRMTARASASRTRSPTAEGTGTPYDPSSRYSRSIELAVRGHERGRRLRRHVQTAAPRAQPAPAVAVDAGPKTRASCSVRPAAVVVDDEGLLDQPVAAERGSSPRRGSRPRARR